MIRRIKTIKNLGIFSNYKEQGIPEFEKFNLIYGLNCSGKTTLSEFFNAFKSGTMEEFPELEYNITSDDSDSSDKVGNNRNNYSQRKHYPKNIKVFNQEYIKNNIDIVSAKAKSIRMVIGAENKELIEQIDKDEKEWEERKTKITNKQNEIVRIKKKKEDKFTDIARTISAIGSGGATRSYRRGNANDDFDELTEKKILLIEDVKNTQKILEQEQKDEVKSIDMDKITAQKFLDIIDRAKKILSITVEIAMIERLNKNKDVSKWVEDGLKLHQELNSKFCEFCEQRLPEKLILQLLGHFNDEDKKIKSDVDVLLSDIDVLTSDIKNIKSPDESRLYNNMQEEYSKAKDKMDSSEGFLLDDIKKLKVEIENKKQNTTKSLALSVNICPKEFISSIEACNVFINQCRTRTSNFEKEKNEAKERLKNHYLSEIYDEVKGIDEEKKNAEKELGLLENGNPKVLGDIAIDKIKERMLDNMNKLSNTTKACSELNKNLKDFLGRDELTFEYSDNEYLIMRKGIPARKLSEGEKTAIAFVYFTIHLKEKGFNIKDSIVVIDDPVSSLDSNSLQTASSFLKEAIKDAHQSFIFTHNIDFLRLSLKWLKGVRKSDKRYYMVKNSNDNNNNRIAILAILEKLLENYDNEYEYLLGCLKNLNDGTMESTYPIPNIARKVLEHFLMFMVSSDGSIRERMKKIDFPNVKKDSICDLFNEESHRSDGNIDLSQERIKNVGYLLEMIETITLRGRVAKE